MKFAIVFIARSALSFSLIIHYFPIYRDRLFLLVGISTLVLHQYLSRFIGINKSVNLFFGTVFATLYGMVIINE
ncbi:hypothetical protein SAMN05216357_10246 [Porphyromonadaceae bacterium KH3CP3RA]|nr:hypothetical protein SAMN05216357_10246 [Porphyromonadaceae bacterium KH3CP3RA]